MGLSIDGLSKVLVTVFGSRNERVVKGMLDTVEEINALEPQMRKLSDKALSGKTEEFRNRLFDGLGGKDFTREEADRELNKLLPEAFAVVREASRRVIMTPDPDNPRPMRHFDVQLIGGMVLHSGAIAEMVTGEGKTLVATLAAYLNALPGRGVHIITVNDYLARRDREWMGPLYEFLGLTAGVIQNQQSPEEKRAAYGCDITFGHDSEFGFDYLRDNMRWSVEEQVQQRGLYYAIVDEVDSVLIDEARTPLIISGPSEESTDKYYVADRAARKLRRDEHFEVKEKEQTAHLTEAGVRAVERILKVDSIYAGRNADWPHHIEQALRAHHLFKRDDEYVVKNGEIIIVDEFTGRLMPGRRWSDGLHQAIEAKEGLRIKEEDQTLATVTYQNFFRLYKKLAGMTGTAMTEAAEFAKIYKLDVVNIPTNLPLIRKEHHDLVYRTHKEKLDAIEEEVVEQHATGRPLLVGTISIEKSEMLSERLKRRGIKHEVLNAKHHEREAQIVAQAGQMGHVTIATNMAGRGTDIVLGEFGVEELLEHWKSCGLAPKHLRADMPRAELERELTEYWAKKFLDEKELKKTPKEKWGERLKEYWAERDMRPLRLCTNVAELGGLHIVGTERHEARRIDNQLRGRAGRQGDPGSSRFFLSLEDDFMRIFASERVSSILKRVGMEEGMAIEAGIVSRSIERAQRKVEEHNFEIRKHLLEYDEVMDEQRKAIYGLRQKIVEHGDLKKIILEMIEDVLEDDLDEFIPNEDAPHDRNGRPFCDWARTVGVDVSVDEWREHDLEGLKGLFRERKAAAWGECPSSAMAEECVEAAMGLLASREEPFYRWRLPGLSRWARRIGLAAEAQEMGEGLLNRVLELVRAGVERSWEGREPGALVDVLLEQVTESYFAGAVAVEEWDVAGLKAWADAVGISLPLSQWQREEESVEDVEADRLSTRLESLRSSIRERLERGLRKATPTEVVTRVACHEVRRRIALLSSEKKGDLRRVLSWLEKGLGVSVSDSEARSAIESERAAISASLSRQLSERLQGMSPEERVRFCVDTMVDTFLNLDLSMPGRDIAGFCSVIHRKYGVALDAFELSKLPVAELGRRTMAGIREAYERREEELGSGQMRMVERYLLLQKIDTKWKDHLLAMDHLKGGIGLRGYAQLDPKVEYTREARKLFDQMESSVRKEVTDLILRLQLGGDEGDSGDIWGGGRESRPDSAAPARRAGPAAGGDIRRQQEAAIAGTEAGERPAPIRVAKGVGRNDPCPCGSGKKYKKCCGRRR